MQGAVIDSQFVKRGKTVSSRSLRNAAKRLDAMVVDYRNMGYVTEVKDQVRHFSFMFYVFHVDRIMNNFKYVRFN